MGVTGERDEGRSRAPAGFGGLAPLREGLGAGGAGGSVFLQGFSFWIASVVRSRERRSWGEDDGA